MSEEKDELPKANNLELWEKVESTNPKYTKNANVGGNKITSISPQYQIKNVTEQFGSYGDKWGFKEIELDYSLVSVPFRREKTEGVYPNKKVVGLEDAFMGLVVFKAIFFYPDGEFPVINSISLFTNNDMTKLDDNFAKKLETDTLTKAMSKLGFNADIFMGKFDDQRYVAEMKEKFKKVVPLPKIEDDKFNGYLEAILAGTTDKKGVVITEAYLKARHTLSPEQEQELANT